MLSVLVIDLLVFEVFETALTSFSTVVLGSSLVMSLIPIIVVALVVVIVLCGVVVIVSLAPLILISIVLLVVALGFLVKFVVLLILLVLRSDRMVVA